MYNPYNYQNITQSQQQANYVPSQTQHLELQSQSQIKKPITSTDFGAFQQNVGDYNYMFQQNIPVTQTFSTFQKQQPQLKSPSNSQGFSNLQQQPIGFIQTNNPGYFNQQPQVGFPSQMSFEQKMNSQQTGAGQVAFSQMNIDQFRSSPSQQGNITNQQLQQTHELRPQQTGFYTQQPLQPQHTAFYLKKPSLQRPQQIHTEFVSPLTSETPNNDLKIPSIRLSFLTAGDQSKFENLFKASVQIGSNTISGKDCRTILMRSGLPPSQLAKIWTLADTNKAGQLLFPEFALAMHLVNSVLQGDSIPFELDTKTKNEISSFIDAINLTIIDSPNAFDNLQNNIPFEGLTAGIESLQPQSTGFMPQISFGIPLQPQITGGSTLGPQVTGIIPQTSFGQQLQPQITGMVPSSLANQQLQPQITGNNLKNSTNSFTTILQPQLTSSLPPTSFGGLQIQYNEALKPQQTGYLPPSNFNPTAPLVAQKTGFGNNELYLKSNFPSKFTAENEDYVSPEEKSLFYKIFDTYDTDKSGLLNSSRAVEIFRKSGLNRGDLEQIWNLCDTNNSGSLNKQEFSLGMHLVYRKLNGYELPTSLPPSLIPSSTKILNEVKDQLKSIDAIESKYKFENFNGLKYQNNDDEVLPSSKNRIKNFVDLKELQRNDEDIKNLKQLIYEKQILLDKEKGRIEQRHLTEESEKHADMEAIERLKQQIRSLPHPKNSLNLVPVDFKLKLERLQGKLPRLLTDISNIDDQITSAKIQLYRLKHPSLIGTGSNNEITDYDRKKSRQKALLASRMAALTGKPIENSVDLEEEERLFNREISTIHDIHEKNQKIIQDIKTSINEIYNSVKLSFEGSLNKLDPDYEKWELGVGIEPEVYAFIKEMNNITRMSQQPESYTLEDPLVNGDSSDSSLGLHMASKPTSERATYIKEQAQKKLNERLAKLGIRDTKQKEASPKGGSLSILNENSDFSTTSRSNALSSKNSCLNTSTRDNTSGISSLQEAEKLDIPTPEDDDEQEQELMKQLRSLKLKRKAEKEERLAKLRQQVEDAKAGKFDDSDDSDVSKVENKESNSNYIYSGSGSSTKMTSDTPIYVERTMKVHNEDNSFDKKVKLESQIQSDTHDVIPPIIGCRNPFFKQPDPVPVFNPEKVQQQRRIQRGFDDGADDWSDDDKQLFSHNKTENEVLLDHKLTPSSIKNDLYDPAQTPQTLNASFSSSNLQVPTKIVSPVDTERESVTEKVCFNTQESEPIPIAPPLPQINCESDNFNYSHVSESSTGVNLVHLSRPDLQANKSSINGNDDSDVLSLPESIESDDNFST